MEEACESHRQAKLGKMTDTKGKLVKVSFSRMITSAFTDLSFQSSFLIHHLIGPLKFLISIFISLLRYSRFMILYKFQVHSMVMHNF